MSHEAMNLERAAFWARLSEEAPELGIVSSPGWEKEIPLRIEGRVRLVVSLSQDKTSVYLVGRSEAAKRWIAAHEGALAQGLRTVAGRTGSEAVQGRWFRKDNRSAAVTQRRQWDEMIRWIKAQYQTFSTAVTHIKDA